MKTKSLGEQLLEALVNDSPTIKPVNDARDYMVARYGSKLRMVCCWYDRSIRLWTAFRVDEDGNQIADAAYDIDRGGAAWLAAEKETHK